MNERGLKRKRRVPTIESRRSSTPEAEAKARRNLVLKVLGALFLSGQIEARAAQPIEHETVPAKIEAMKEAFTHKLEPSIEKGIIADVGRHDYELYREALDTYPLEAVLASLAEQSNLPIEQLIQHENLTAVFPYTDTTVHDIRVQLQAESMDTTDPTIKAAMTDLNIHATGLANLGGESFANTFIGLNLQDVHELMDTAQLNKMNRRLNNGDPVQRDRYFRTMVQYLLTHEIIHSLDDDEYQAYAQREISPSLNEGLVDSIAIATLPVFESDPDYYPSSGFGYEYGNRHAGRYLILSLEGHLNEVIADTLLGNHKHLQGMFDANYGLGAWQRVIDFRLPIPAGEQSSNITTLFALIRETRDKQGLSVVEKMNSMWVTQVHPIMDQGKCTGVYITDPDLPYIKSGVMVRDLTTVPGSQLVLGFSDKSSIPLRSMPTVDPHTHVPGPQSWYKSSPMPLRGSGPDEFNQILINIADGEASQLHP